MWAGDVGQLAANAGADNVYQVALHSSRLEETKDGRKQYAVVRGSGRTDVVSFVQWKAHYDEQKRTNSAVYAAWLQVADAEAAAYQDAMVDSLAKEYAASCSSSQGDASMRGDGSDRE